MRCEHEMTFVEKIGEKYKYKCGKCQKEVLLSNASEQLLRGMMVKVIK